MKKLSIILVSYKDWDITLSCLKSLSRVRSESAEISIIIVDNASFDKPSHKRSDIASLNSPISIYYIESKINLGFCGGNNRGIRQAVEDKADFIMLLNNDTLVDDHFIDPLLTWFDTHPQTGIAGPKIYFEQGYEFHKDRYAQDEKGKVIWYAGGILDWDNVYASHRGVDEVDIGQYNNPVKTQFVTGCCMVFPTILVDQIGYLDERYFMYLEDVDFSLRAEKRGYDLWFIADSHVFHKNAQSSGSGSDLHVYYQTRNRLLFGMKFAPLKTKLALLRHSVHVIRTNKDRRQAVLDFFLMKFGKKEQLHQD